MDVLEAIRTRKSVKKLRGPAPGASEVAEMLELAATAPDHGGLSPWRFKVLTGPELESFPLDAGSSPMVVVVGAEPQGEKIRAEEQVAAVAAASQLLLLAADSMGYGAMWRTGSAAYDPAVASAAGLSSNGKVVAFIHLGTPDDGGSGASPKSAASSKSAAPAKVAAPVSEASPTSTAATSKPAAAAPAASKPAASMPKPAAKKPDVAGGSGDLGIGSLRDR